MADTQLVYHIEYVARDDTFRATKKVCKMLESGAQAIFGPSNERLAAHVQSICEHFNVPHFETRIDLNSDAKKFSINVHPSNNDISMAYRDFIVHLNWTKVALIYESDYGKYRLD